MEDSPEQFVKDVVVADQRYAENFNPDFLMANLRFGDFVGVALGIPERITKTVSRPFMEYVMRTSRKNAKPNADKIIRIIDNPPSCIDDYVAYHGLQYIAKVEGPWSVDIIKDTFLKEYTKVPEGTEQLLYRLGNIPPCESSLR